jgi:hypothetical protein
VLIGNTDVEDALQRLNNLTEEEARIASAELLRTSRGLGEGVHRVGVEVDRANRQHFSTLLSLLLYLIYPHREPPQI